MTKKTPSPGYISLSKTDFATAATAIAMVIPIDIMPAISNHYSTVNQRAIAMVNQWLHWKPLQWPITLSRLYITLKNSFRNGTVESHCNGYSHWHHARSQQLLFHGESTSHCNGKSMAPLEAIATANYLLLAIFRLQKQLSQLLQRQSTASLQRRF